MVVLCKDIVVITLDQALPVGMALVVGRVARLSVVDCLHPLGLAVQALDLVTRTRDPTLTLGGFIRIFAGETLFLRAEVWLVRVNIISGLNKLGTIFFIY